MEYPTRMQMVGWACVLTGTLAATGCQQKMAGQPSYRALEPSEFFADGRSARPQAPGTVARGHLQTDLALFTGRKTRTGRNPPIAEPSQAANIGKAKTFDENRDFVDAFPILVEENMIQHGRDRYTIFCSVCHDALGTGYGKIVERGYTRPPSYHIPRLRAAPVGRLFAVVSEGYGSMPSYAAQIPPEDRWAIIAYIRALQLSQRFPERELTGAMRGDFQRVAEHRFP